MELKDFQKTVDSLRDFTCFPDGDVLRVVNIKTQSQFISEISGDIIQIRQAVKFDCSELPQKNICDILSVCSSVNERFTLTKAYIDRWGVLVNSSELHVINARSELLSIYLNQTEFISLAILSLLEIMDADKRSISDEDIDAVLSERL